MYPHHSVPLAPVHGEQAEVVQNMLNYQEQRQASSGGVKATDIDYKEYKDQDIRRYSNTTAPIPPPPQTIRSKPATSSPQQADLYQTRGQFPNVYRMSYMSTPAASANNGGGPILDQEETRLDLGRDEFEVVEQGQFKNSTVLVVYGVIVTICCCLPCGENFFYSENYNLKIKIIIILLFICKYFIFYLKL